MYQEVLLRAKLLLNMLRVLRLFHTIEDIFHGFSTELIPEWALRQPYWY
jgi:hypothetical protein